MNTTDTGDRIAPTYDARHLVAEIEVLLHHHGIHTLAGGALSAIAAAEDLLVALGVAPAEIHPPLQYRVRLERTINTALAGTEDAAETLARAWDHVPSSLAGRTHAVVEPVAVRGVAA